MIDQDALEYLIRKRDEARRAANFYRDRVIEYQQDVHRSLAEIDILTQIIEGRFTTQEAE